jgi:hypothetical protein
MKKFIALAVANIEEDIAIKNGLIDMKIGPVYENGMQFSGEVLAIGIVSDDCDLLTLKDVVSNHLREYVEFVSVKKIEFREEAKQEINEYRRAS